MMMVGHGHGLNERAPQLPLREVRPLVRGKQGLLKRLAPTLREAQLKPDKVKSAKLLAGPCTLPIFGQN